MTHLSRSLAPLTLAVVLLAGCNAEMPTSPDLSGLESVPGTASAHESNNRADLSGMQDGAEITGQAIVNFVNGAPNPWRSTVNLQGDLDAGTYDFYVTLNGGNETLVCSFTLSGNGGRQGCNADTNVPGFNMGEVREADGGDVVASGTFERRGGTRF